MKKILKNTMYFFAFAGAGILFQISCSNSDDQNTQNPEQLGKIIYSRSYPAGQKIWICDYNGQNQKEIPISLPNNLQFKLKSGDGNPKLSPDGKKIFFVVTINGSDNAIYSCDITGDNVREIVGQAENSSYYLGSVN